jgi:hypothetical protein
LDAGRLWTPGGCGRREAVDAGRLWMPGGCGRREAVDAGRLWTPGGCGREGGCGCREPGMLKVAVDA